MAADPTQNAMIEVHIHDVRQIFDSMDPSPFRERDLDQDAEEYIVQSAKELPNKRRPCELVVHLDKEIDFPEGVQSLEAAIREHFVRRTLGKTWELRELLRRGWISLAIGLLFVSSAFIASEIIKTHMGDNHIANVLSESLQIGGWVAMWTPMQILLYEWWPLIGDRRIYERLSRISVRLNSSRAPAVT